MKERARGLALSLLDLGEDLASVERQLHRWRFHPAVAHEAVRWACERKAEAGPAPTSGSSTGTDLGAQAARMAASWPAPS